MSRRISLAAVLLLATVLLAQDAAGPTFTPYGMVQYRLRLQMYSLTPVSGSAMSSMDYANQLSYQAGLKTKVNESVFVQFQAGNDWVSTEAVSWNINNWGAVGHARGNFPYFHLAFAKWTAEKFYLVAGIQPVSNNGPLDLVERSMISNNYKNAGLITWIVGTNASQTGLKIGAPILKEGFKLSAELFTSVTTSRTQTIAATPKSNPSAVMMLLDLPMSVAALTITPQVVAILNRNYNSFAEQGDMETGFGFAGSYKVKDGVAVTACLGLAMVANTNSAANSIPDTSDHVDGMKDAAKYDNSGMIAGVGGTVKCGPGNAIVDFKYSTDENKEVTNSSSSYIYVDAKYGWDVNKNFQLMPRVRLFLTQYETTNSNKSKMETRPELIFTGKF